MAEWSTLARPYARAAFEFALEHNALGEWSRQLAQLAAVTATEKVGQLIDSVALGACQRAETLIGLFNGELQPGVVNLVRLLAMNKRLRLLPQISALFEQLKANQEKHLEVELVSAFPLDSDLSERLAQALRGKLQREVTINTTVDRGILGGAIVRAGDIVIDGSVRGRLTKLAKSMNSRI
jgi:F-type H+-transporting ATPase subunit delta